MAREEATRAHVTELERQRVEAEERQSQLASVTEADRVREVERALAQKEYDTFGPLHNLYTDLPELPDVPESFWQLEATFHQSPAARKHDIVSHAGSLPSLRERPSEEAQLDRDETYFMRMNPTRWRRRSFSRGHAITLAEGFREQLDENEEEEDEWKPAPLTDHNIPDNSIASGLLNVLNLVNAPIPQASKPLAAIPSSSAVTDLPNLPILPVASKPVALFGDEERRALEQVEAAAREHATRGVLEDAPKHRVMPGQVLKQVTPKKKKKIVTPSVTQTKSAVEQNSDASADIIATGLGDVSESVSDASPSPVGADAPSVTDAFSPILEPFDSEGFYPRMTPSPTLCPATVRRNRPRIARCSITPSTSRSWTPKDACVYRTRP